MTGAPDSHEIKVRVYYEDTDAQGIVYFANYFRFMERGRTEWLRARDVDQMTLLEHHNVCFSVTSATVQFRAPAKLDDELVVRTTVTTKTRARVIFETKIHRHSADGELLCVGESVVACLAVDTLKPQQLPVGIFREE